MQIWCEQLESSVLKIEPDHLYVEFRGTSDNLRSIQNPMIL